MPYEDDYKMWLEKMLIDSNPDWICDEMCDVELTHEWCHKHCGDDYVTPKCLHMFYHHIVRADRKTENSSEKPNNCEVKNYCDDCLYTDTCDSKAFFYACTSKATISKMEQVDEPKTQMKTQNSNLTFEKADEPRTDEDCDYCKMTHKYWYEHCDTCKHKPKDEPQTDCAWREL